MAPTLDAATFDDGGSNSSSSYSHTVTGSETYLLVYVATGDGTTNAIEDVTGVTYNSISMSELATDFEDTHVNLHLFGLVAPASGSNTVAITLGGTPDGHASIAASYTAVNQSTPIGTAANNSGTAQPATVAVSSASGELVSAGSVVGNESSGSLGQETVVLDNQLYASNERIGVQEKAGETSTVLNWNLSGSKRFAACGVPLKPAGAASSGGTMRRRFGPAAFVSMAGPTMSAFGQIFARSKTGLMVPERMTT